MVGGGPSDFIVNQSPNLWIFGFKTFDLDFGLDNNDRFYFHSDRRHNKKM